MSRIDAYSDGIHAIDSSYQRPRMAAIHLIVENGRAAIIDSASAHAVPQVLAALREAGLTPEAVDWLLLTHVHLDHAGGAGALLQALPNARLVVHPRGAPHMIAPDKLWASTVVVYGEAEARALYGEIVAVPADRVLAADDGLIIDLAGRRIEVLDTPGHARHHVCYFDHRSRGCFTGDAFGLSYRETDAGSRAFVFPATTPVQFEPEAMHASIDKILARQPECLFLTHYGRVGEPTRLGADLHRLIDDSVAIARASHGLTGDAQFQALRAALATLLRQEAAEHRWGLQEEALVALYGPDLDLNAQGLQHWLAREMGAPT